MKKHLFTSESVTQGHPDKVADQISDAILDAILAKDPMARVACETMICKGLVLISGEISTTASVDYVKIARDTIREIGYKRAKYGFDADTCGVICSINEQSSDISMGVSRDSANDQNDRIGAGDQGMMFGYATNETDNYMPYAIDLAHKLARELSELRKNKTLDYLRPDGKTQVSVEYEDDKVKRIENIVISCQHDEKISLKQIELDIKKELIDKVVDSKLIDDNTKIYINPTGKFVLGGPFADTGLTGRKIIVDTYGGYASHGGGAFSGKDPTKVDRSAAYMARYVAKNIVAANLAEKIQIGISYAIGVSKPLSIFINSFNTAKLSDEKLVEIINKEFDLRPASIIDTLDLRKPIYQKLASYGHFGRTDLDLTWEKLDKVNDLKKYLV